MPDDEKTSHHPSHWDSIDHLPIHPTWKPALEPVMDQIRELGRFLEAEDTAGRGFLPARDNIFRAFTYPFDEVKVLIVGQDPYPTPGHAMGLSFSTQPGVRPLPRSLRNIFKELATDVGVVDLEDGDLTPWSQQGVMLLNRVLTVAPGEANSHKGRGWEKVTQAAITALGRREQPLVAILWGKQAQEVQKFLGDTPCITSAHPSPLSASRGFFGSTPFTGANDILESLGTTPVRWQL